MKSILGSHRRPDLIFRKNGHFDLTARVARLLNLASGDVIDVMSDGREYYLYVARRAENTTHGRFEALCCPTNKAGMHFRGSSVRLCRLMLDLCNASGRVALFCGSPATDVCGRTLLPIIIRTSFNKP